MAQFKKDRMTERERLLALLNRQPIDRIPFNIFAFAFSAINVGYRKDVYHGDPDKSFEAMRCTHEMYDGWRWIYFSPGPFGAKEFGGEIKMPANAFGQSASVVHTPVGSKKDIWKLEVPDVKTAGGIPLIVRFSQLQVKCYWPVIFCCGSILKTVGYTARVDRMCHWVIRKLELVHRLCGVVADFCIALAKYWVNTFGHPELMIPFWGAPTESNQVISPNQFHEFSVAYQAEVHKKTIDMGIKHIHVHICGKHNLNLPQ